MADGWLPKGFESTDLDAPARIAAGVRRRIHTHRRRVRIAQGGAAAVALAAILGLAPLLWRSGQAPQAPVGTIAGVGAIADREPQVSPSATAPTATLAARAPSPHPPTTPSPQIQETGTPADPAVTVALDKAAGKVELAWTGDAAARYEVYRCTSPKLDQCALAGVVRGTTWREEARGGAEVAPGSVVYYKVEARRGA